MYLEKIKINKQKKNLSKSLTNGDVDNPGQRGASLATKVLEGRGGGLVSRKDAKAAGLDMAVILGVQ